MSDADGVAENTGDPQLTATRNRGDGPSDPDETLLLPASEPFRAAELVSEPKSIRPYQLIGKLGEGGMGQVWLGEQTAPISRSVQDSSSLGKAEELDERPYTLFLTAGRKSPGS
jgi:hypothetical protein